MELHGISDRVKNSSWVLRRFRSVQIGFKEG